MPNFMFRGTSSQEDHPEDVLVFQHTDPSMTKERYVQIISDILVELLQVRATRMGYNCVHDPASWCRDDLVTAMRCRGFAVLEIDGDVGVDMDRDPREWFRPSQDGCTSGENPIYTPRFSGNDSTLIGKEITEKWNPQGEW